jgi:Leucine-rich repeat (LRR) protein
MKSVFIFIIFLSSVSTATTANEPVSFVDPELKEVVAAKLNVSNPTPNDMLALSELSANGIIDLGGLEYAKNLIKLRIDNTILIVYRHNNRYTEKRIEDISALSTLSGLTSLELIRNHITDISPIKSLTKLKELNLRENRINDISALSALSNLETLDISDNESLNDISTLSILLNIKQLRLSSNKISDINNLSTLKQLEWLDLNENDISDISVLSSLKNLRVLSLYRNHVQDITPLKELKNLSDLNLQFNNISNASTLSSLPSLKNIDIRNNPYYLKRFITISIIILIATLFISISLQIYLNKNKPERRKLCRRTKYSIFCLIFAPFTLWFSGFKLRYLLLGSTMITQNNLFVLGPMFGLLITGFICAISVLVASKNNQNCTNSKHTTIAVLIFLIIVSFFCFYGTLGFLLRNA